MTISYELLKAYAEWEPVDGDPEQNEISEIAAELLRRREMDRWIPVSERLPKIDKRVLIYDSGSTYIDNLYENIAFGTKEWAGVEVGTLTHVTHWRPLPEPPEAQA